MAIRAPDGAKNPPPSSNSSNIHYFTFQIDHYVPKKPLPPSHCSLNLAGGEVFKDHDIPVTIVHEEEDSVL